MYIENDNIYIQIKNKYGWNNYMSTNSCSSGEIMVAYEFKTFNHVFYSKSKDGFERLVEYDACGNIIHYEETNMTIDPYDNNLHLPCNIRIANKLIKIKNKEK